MGFVLIAGVAAIFAISRISPEKLQTSAEPPASSITANAADTPNASPILADDTSTWNEAKNAAYIKNSFVEPVRLFDDDESTQKIFRSFYDRFVEAKNKKDLQILSEKISAAKSKFENGNLSRSAKDLLFENLDVASYQISERIKHFGEPSTEQSTIAEMPMPPKPVNVGYKIIAGSNSKWSATYENAQGGTEQITDGVGSWKKKMDVSRGSYLYLSAQNSEKFGGIIVYITVNGEEVKRSEGSGGYSIASASYKVPDK